MRAVVIDGCALLSGKLEALYEPSLALIARRDFADALPALIQRLRATFDLEGCAVALPDELAAYARAHNVATVVLGHPTHSRWEEFLHGSVTNDLLRKMLGVGVIAARDQARRKVRDEAAWP